MRRRKGKWKRDRETRRDRRTKRDKDRDREGKKKKKEGVRRGNECIAMGSKIDTYVCKSTLSAYLRDGFEKDFYQRGA